ncbi:MAG: hypothetical protein HKN79_08880 [Flavobacteriales bacterium]|nr:hypothetical protein [Flavobacteriales bacterium]
MRISLLIIMAVILAFTACRKDEQINTDSGLMLEFSRDTVLFDTVFTTVGTATQLLKVYNRSNQAAEVSSIYLGEGQGSAYRINVDGDPGHSFSDVLIQGEDSIFIFIEVTIDPNGINTPLIEMDSLVFVTNGNEQHVDLVAWGQDACFYNPTNDISGLPPLTCLDGDCLNEEPPVDITWTNEKPIVIYGYLVIDEFDKLTIEAGTQIFLHEGSGIWVWEGGQLTVNGTAEAPVVFQHDRPEELYDDIPGQWDLIRINEGPVGQDNELNHVIIKNSIIGIEAKPLVLQEEDIDKPTSENQLILNNCIIQQTTAFGLLARKYRISATNCLFANSGQQTVGISGGGAYDFTHCTMGNYWIWSNRTEPSFFMSDLYLDEAGNPNQAFIESFSAKNCIMYGNTFEEFLVDLSEFQPTEDIVFSYCMVRVDEMDISDETIYQDMYSNEFFGPGFIAPSENDFHLEEDAFVIDKGDPGFFLGEDLEGNLRTPPGDLGCYEYSE